MATVHKKVVVVGDDWCGKTSLLKSFYHIIYPITEYSTPCDFNNVAVEMQVAGKMVELTLVDTVSSHSRLRPLSYDGADVIILCFSIGFPQTLATIYNDCMEVRRYAPGVPIILVGTKKDLRSDVGAVNELRRASQTPVSEQEGRNVAQMLDAKAYVECSARTLEGVREVFERATTVAMSWKKKSGKCTIL